jgi:hypothetical protein
MKLFTETKHVYIGEFIHKVPKLISYIALGKCWAIPGKDYLKVVFY